MGNICLLAVDARRMYAVLLPLPVAATNLTDFDPERNCVVSTAAVEPELTWRVQFPARGLAGGVALEVVAEQRRRAGIAGAAAGAGAARSAGAAAGAAPAAAGAAPRPRCPKCRRRRRPWCRRAPAGPTVPAAPVVPAVPDNPAAPDVPAAPAASPPVPPPPAPVAPALPPPVPGVGEPLVPEQDRVDSASAPVRETTLSLIIGRC